MTMVRPPALGATLEALGPDRPRAAEESARHAELRRVATEFEAVFLAQMLKHAGAGKTPEAFGGGAGEDAFADMLTGEQAKLMAERGGIGLGERLFQALLEKEGLGDGR
ncbi:MAG: rod-binding protein [Rubrimonas sp.]|uniref:rod-binding protein n=1 Tax=Rubrimonas sp. TaxID=2036015 RepID=UPI002FDE9442